ncbi:MAG: hypothetical protein BBJ60_01945 [Desulfobacterales bacterium S7086C20]|nr:MAG: hypothetical protein BBJ60_01945 [Desulfobacterales bacterium S7086C20]
MKWKIFSRKKRKDEWRLIYNPEGKIVDLVALPGAVIEGRLAGRYLMSSSVTKGTVIISGVSQKGILAGVDVAVDHKAASENSVEIAYQPRSGRASLRPAETINFEEMMLEAKSDFDPVLRDPDDLACILYTSGTTGLPKGVRLTVENFVSEQQATEQALDVTTEDKIIGVLPFFHVFGLSNVFHLALVHGASIVLIPQYSPGNLLKTITKHLPTLMVLIPTMFGHLQVLLERRKKGLPDSIRVCVSGAAPLPRETIEIFERASGCKVLEGYGLTETVSACCLNPIEGISKPGSIGLPLSGFEMKVVDENGKKLPSGEVGEITVRGDAVSRGYYNLEGQTRQSFIDGWFLTGDMGYRDQDGFFFITDRKKEIIIKGGLNISPREVEDVLSQHQAVKDVAVIGRKKGEREEIVAFVTTKKEISKKELTGLCRSVLSNFKIPDEICFVDVLPMSITGKVLKKELAEDYQDERRIEQDENGSG